MKHDGIPLDPENAARGALFCPLRFQSGVIPWRVDGTDLEVLLVTRNSGKGWTIPKGIIERPLSACESAEGEAWEEAGVRGRVCPEQVGEYLYRKWGGICHVRVFAMRVDGLAETWPEVSLRQRRWFAVSDAVSVIGKRHLRAVFVDAVPRIHRSFSGAPESSTG